MDRHGITPASPAGEALGRMVSMGSMVAMKIPQLTLDSI